MDKASLLKRFNAFMQNLKKEDKILLLFHGDTDGVTCGVILSKAMERLRGKPADLVKPLIYERRGLSQELFQLMDQEKVNKVVIADWNIDQSPDDVKRMEETAELLIIDHHKLYQDLNSEKTVFVKAQFINEEIDPSKYPTAKLSFDLLSDLVDLKDLDWVVAAGILGDSSYDAWKEFVDDVMKKFDWQEPVYESKLWDLTQFINGLEALNKPKLAESFEIFFKAEKPEQVLENDLSKYGKILTIEVDKWVKVHKEQAEFYPELELIYYPIKSEYYVKSAVGNEISKKLYPDQTVIVALDTGKDEILLSARRQDFKVKMNELLGQAVKGLDGIAGGHIPAAGGSVQRKDLNKFKQNILRILKEGSAKNE
jgi:single-stranded DNA-specific DHH superfamily exonuclease